VDFDYRSSLNWDPAGFCGINPSIPRSCYKCFSFGWIFQSLFFMETFQMNGAISVRIDTARSCA
jgi:hypothetical protein